MKIKKILSALSLMTAFVVSSAPVNAKTPSPRLKCDKQRCEEFLKIFFKDLKETCLDDKGDTITSEQCRDKFFERNGLWKKECEGCNFQELYKKVRPEYNLPTEVSSQSEKK